MLLYYLFFYGLCKETRNCCLNWAISHTLGLAQEEITLPRLIWCCPCAFIGRVVAGWWTPPKGLVPSAGPRGAAWWACVLLPSGHGGQVWGTTSIQGYVSVLSYSSILQHNTRFQQHPKIWELSTLPSSPATQIPLAMCVLIRLVSALTAHVPFPSFHSH